MGIRFLIVLIFSTLFLNSGEIELIKFYSGKVAKADEVNSNFSSLKSGIDDHRSEIESLRSRVTELEDSIKRLETIVENMEVKSSSEVDLTDYGVRYTRSGDTVTDHQTGYKWSDIETEKLSWEESINYCKSLTLDGITDWSLATSDQVESILNRDYTPTVDTIFKNIEPDIYWTSTEFNENSEKAYRVSLNVGDIKEIYKTNKKHSFCVSR
jgi:hypothetical protein